MVTIFFVLFIGFPRISWNVGPESKYLELVKIGLSNKLDHRTTTKKEVCFFVHRARKAGFAVEGSGLEGEQIARHVGERVAGWSETSLQLSGRARMPHWVEGGPFMCISYFLEGCGNVHRQKAL